MPSSTLDPDLTPTPDPDRAGGPPSAPPGYEILGELGRGGMGVVYQARQVKAERTVALKMILPGAEADGERLARFRLEGEAVARMQHPHVVQVFEVGEHNGLPYFSLELCAGGTLGGRLARGPMPAGEAAGLMECLARAVHAAHCRGIIHRDLKPDNVLLTAEGTPKVTDFGLAKRLEGEDRHTKTGAVLGTPAYMAPEQAAGRVHEIGPWTDVYALGVLLYQCLTGRTPFEGPNHLLLFLILEREPAPPGRQAPGCPRDLETICLKCLAKQPHQRYPSAEMLAEDLARFQRGEPIAARRVGRLERAWRWCRRNPEVAGLLGALLVVLLGASVVSLHFAHDAAGKARQARAQEEVASRRAAELGEVNAELEKTLARSLLRPLGLEAGPLTDPEIEALWELAGYREEGVRYRFVEEAARRPVTTRQLRNRAALAVHATVGLDTRQRAEVERRLLARMSDPLLPPAQRRDLALVAIALGDPSPEAAPSLAAVFLEALDTAIDPADQRYLAEGLAVLGPQLKPRQAAQAAATLARALGRTSEPSAQGALAEALTSVADGMEPREGWNALVGALGKTSGVRTPSRQGLGLPRAPDAREVLAVGLSKAVARLGPEAAAELARPLPEVIAGARDAPTRKALALGLASLSVRMKPEEAAGLLIRALANVPDDGARTTLSDALSAVAGRMAPEEVARTADTLLDAIARAPHPRAKRALAAALASLAGRMEPGEAGRLCSRAAGHFTEALAATKNPQALGELASGLASVAARMEPAEARQACSEAAALLSEAMGRTTDPISLGYLAPALAEVSAPLEPEEASRLCFPAARAVLDALAGAEAATWQDLYPGLPALAERLQPREAGEVVGRLGQALAAATHPLTLNQLPQALAPLTARMEPGDAAAVLTDILRKERSPYGSSASYYAGLALAQVAARLGPEEAARAASRLTEEGSRPGLPPAEFPRAQGLAALADRMDPETAADLLARFLAGSPSPTSYSLLGPVLSRSLERMKEEDARRAGSRSAATLAGALGRATDPAARGVLAQGLATVSARLEPREASRLCSPAAGALTEALTGSTDPAVSFSLAQGLAALTARLEPPEASRLCSRAATALLQAMAQAKDPDTWQALSRALYALTERMSPREAGQAAARFARALEETPVPAPAYPAGLVSTPAFGRRGPNGQPFSALVDRMEAPERGPLAAALLASLARRTDSAGQGALASGLSAVAARLEPEEAVRVLTQALAGTTDRSAQRRLAEGLSEAAARTDPATAGQVVAILTEVLAKADAPAAQEAVTRRMRAVLVGRAPQEGSPGENALGVSVGLAGAGNRPLPALALAGPALADPPCRLTTQQLVDLLKQPTCIGPSRREILTQLGRRFGRSFSDHWEFVRFAAAREMGLDFTSSPTRLSRQLGHTLPALHPSSQVPPPRGAGALGQFGNLGFGGGAGGQFGNSGGGFQGNPR